MCWRLRRHDARDDDDDDDDDDDSDDSDAAAVSATADDYEMKMMIMVDPSLCIKGMFSRIDTRLTYTAEASVKINIAIMKLQSRNLDAHMQCTQCVSIGEMLMYLFIIHTSI